jgi:hypothetical protein
MTKTVVKKVSSNVKVLRPGSKPLTQSNTEKAKIAAKAKTKTPAAKSADAARKAAMKRDEKFNQRLTRTDILRQARDIAAKGAGYKAGTGNLTPAMVKAANKAQAVKEREIKAAKVARAAAAKVRGGSGMRGGVGSFGTGSGLRGSVNK